MFETFEVPNFYVSI